MDWTKLNFNEIGYFCKSTKAGTDFDCFPLSYQIEVLLGILSYYKIDNFQINDIQKIYKVLHLRKMNGDGILEPLPKKIMTILEKLETEGKVVAELNSYIITSKNNEERDLYKESIEKGYQKDYISGWIEYDRKNVMLKTEYLS